MTKKQRNKLLLACLTVALIASAVWGYSFYRKRTGVYVETVRQGNGWGYKIYVKGQLVVNQYVMPAVKDSRPFPCEEAARRTGDTVVARVGRGEMPTVSLAEVNRIVAESCGQPH